MHFEAALWEQIDCLNYDEISENNAPGRIFTGLSFLPCKQYKSLVFSLSHFPKSEIFSVINLEAVAIRLNCRSGQKHCSVHCIEEWLKRALKYTLKYSKLMMLTKLISLAQILCISTHQF